MNDIEFIKAIAKTCDALLRNAAQSFDVDFDVLNRLMLEVQRRAFFAGIPKDELWPKRKK